MLLKSNIFLKFFCVRYIKVHKKIIFPKFISLRKIVKIFININCAIKIGRFFKSKFMKNIFFECLAL